jgi:hypothetical protein
MEDWPELDTTEVIPCRPPWFAIFVPRRLWPRLTWRYP